MITQDDMKRMQEKWDINFYPSYRAAECNDCGRKIHKMWHCWLDHKGWKKEAHVCRQCGVKYGLVVNE